MPTIFTSHPTPESSREYEVLHYEVGKTLSVWMGVEIQVQQTFTIALGARHGSAASAVFRAAINSNARLAMADEAVTHCLMDLGDGPLLQRWKRLFDRAKKQAKGRNAVAHGQVVVVTGPTDKNGDSYGIGARLIDPTKPPRAVHDPKRDLVENLSIAQLKEMQVRFQTLAHEIFVHGQDLQKRIMEAQDSAHP